MDEELMGSSNWYGGVEPIDVGNLDDVKEERQVIPASKGVELQIVNAEIKANKANTYRSIKLQLRLTQGLVDGKYKNKIVFTSVCYYADPTVYTKDFFTKKQHLIQLKYLKRAIGYESNTVDGHLIDELNNKQLLGDIVVKKSKFMVDNGKGGKEEIEQLDNEVKNFKSMSVEMQV
jgi:hypothetical protein